MNACLRVDGHDVPRPHSHPSQRHQGLNPETMAAKVPSVANQLRRVAERCQAESQADMVVIYPLNSTLSPTSLVTSTVVHGPMVSESAAGPPRKLRKKMPPPWEVAVLPLRPSASAAGSASSSCRPARPSSTARSSAPSAPTPRSSTRSGTWTGRCLPSTATCSPGSRSTTPCALISPWGSARPHAFSGSSPVLVPKEVSPMYWTSTPTSARDRLGVL